MGADEDEGGEALESNGLRLELGARFDGKGLVANDDVLGDPKEAALERLVGELFREPGRGEARRRKEPVKERGSRGQHKGGHKTRWKKEVVSRSYPKRSHYPPLASASLGNGGKRRFTSVSTQTKA